MAGIREANEAVTPSLPSIHERIAGRRLRVGVFDSRAKLIVAKRIFDHGEDVTIGGDAGAALVVPGWSDGPLLLIAEGQLLHLAPGMRLHMCHDGGVDRVVGEYEELRASGIALPIPITVAMVNIRIRDGLSLFARYLAEDEPMWPESSDWSKPVQA